MMHTALRINGHVLHITLAGVEDAPEARGRVCNIELALLRYYWRHASDPVAKAADGTLTFSFHRGASDYATFEGACRVLSGFGINLTRIVVGHYATDR